MSDFFHKSCYTSRSTGYKYRTLSTNTGYRKRRDASEVEIFDRNFKELRRVMLSRVNKEVGMANQSRECMKVNTGKIDLKIESLIELQNVVGALRNSLRTAVGELTNIVDRVNRLDKFLGGSDRYSVKSLKSLRSYPKIDEGDDNDSLVNHV